jgi:hypothetical protein
MVMQRIANPPIPVRFRVSPPDTRPGGEIGRHNGLKIRRNRKTCVPVRFRFRAPGHFQIFHLNSECEFEIQFALLNFHDTLPMSRF